MNAFEASAISTFMLSVIAWMYFEAKSIRTICQALQDIYNRLDDLEESKRDIDET